MNDPTVKTKSYPAAFLDETAGGIEGDEAGFTAIVSVFNNVDRGGDIVRPGAFKDSIAAWKNSGDALPVLWSHRMDDPNYNIGHVKDIEEISAGDARIPDSAHPWVKQHGGLWVHAVLDEEPTASPIAKQVRHLLKTRRVTQFSFAYEVLEQRDGEQEGTTELLKLWLHEVGPTPIGMNGLTELVSAKAERPPDDPPEQPEQAIEPQERGPSAALLRVRYQIAALVAEHDIAD